MQVAMLAALGLTGFRALPPGYAALLAPTGSHLVIARKMSNSVAAIFRLQSSNATKVADLPGSADCDDGVNAFVKQGNNAVLIVSSAVYRLTFGGRQISVERKGAVETLPHLIKSQWVGSFIGASEKRILYTLSAEAYREAEEPTTLLSFSVIAERPLYRVQVGLHDFQFEMSDQMPITAAGAFGFGTTVIWGSGSLAERWIVGQEIGGSGYYICRKRTNTSLLCSIWLCRVSLNSLQPVARICEVAEWANWDKDEAFLVGDNALLCLFDGNVMRHPWLVNLRTRAVKMLSNDMAPPSPTTTSSAVYGTYFEWRATRSGSTADHVWLYRLTARGLSRGELPRPWFQVYGSDSGGYFGQQKRRGQHIQTFRLKGFPTLRGTVWSIQKAM